MASAPFLPGWQGIFATLIPDIVLVWMTQSVHKALKKARDKLQDLGNTVGLSARADIVHAFTDLTDRRPELKAPWHDSVRIVFTFVRNLFLCAALEFLGVVGVKGDISRITSHPMSYWSSYAVLIISFTLYTINRAAVLGMQD